MSTEDETYDIDLYGDEPEDEGNGSHVLPNATSHEQSPGLQRDAPVDAAHGAQRHDQHDLSRENNSVTGTKRKAPDDEHDETTTGRHDDRPLDQGAQPSLKLTELQWWTTEEDLRAFCAQARCEDELIEVAFGEHKINGKSRGEAYLEFETPQAAGMVKREIEKANADLEAGHKMTIVGAKTKISVWYTAPGNPFKVREGQVKKETGKYGQQSGAYNNYGNNRGGFAGRGRGGYQRGGGNQWSNQGTNNNNNHSNTFNSGMMNGYGNMGFGGFPMGMNQNAMMNMMGSGFNMPAMGMMSGMMAGRGGANMMGRGGYNQNSFPRGGYNASYDGNKKPRTE